jgi:putative ABC transport system permease protein
MDAVAKLLLLIVLIVVVLITILMERSFIADEKSEIAIAKAVGFKDSTVIRWHVNRFFFVALVAMLLAVVLSIPMTDLCISPIFGMMGASDIDYNYDILRCFVMYPGIILIVTVVTAFITALYTKKIVSRDTASIE